MFPHEHVSEEVWIKLSQNAFSVLLHSSLGGGIDEGRDKLSKVTGGALNSRG